MIDTKQKNGILNMYAFKKSAFDFNTIASTNTKCKLHKETKLFSKESLILRIHRNSLVSKCDAGHCYR